MADNLFRRSTLVLILILAALVGGAMATLHGLVRLRLPEELPWRGDGIRLYAGLLLALAIAVLGASRALRIGIAASAAIVTAVLLTAFGALWPLIVTLALALASLLVGARLRRLWNDAVGVPGEPIVDLLIGLGAYGTVISVLAHVPVNHAAIYALLLALPIVLDRRAALDWLGTIVAAIRTPRTTPASAWIAGILAPMYGVVALFPEIAWDALVVHLFIPSHLAIHRSWNFDVTRYAWAVMPALVDWIYAIGYLLDGERAARLANAAFVVVGAGLVFRLAVLAGASAAWAHFAAGLYLATPVTFLIGSSLFIDAAWTAFLLGAVVMLLRPQVPGHPPHGWITAAALLGFAAAAKAVTLPLLPAFALMVLANHRALRVAGGWRTLAIAAAVFVVAAAKPYLAAWLITGNPVYPFYMNVFGGPPFDSWATGPETFRARLGLTLPYDINFHPDRFIEGRPGSGGFQWLLLFPAALAALVATWHRRGLALVIVGCLMVALVFPFQTYLRYVAPAFAILIGALGVAGTAMSQSSKWSARAFAAVGMIALATNLVFLNAAGFYPDFPLDTVATAPRRRAFLEQRLPMRSAAELAARLPASGERLAFFGQPVFAAVPGVEALHPSWYTPRFLEAVRAVRSPEDMIRVLQSFNVRYVVADASFGGPELRRLVDAATRPLIAFHGVSVRELPPDRFFQDELLNNPELGATGGWSLHGSARHDSAGHVRVTVDSPAFQLVPVVPGRIYRNAVTARCKAPGEARVQVNWLDAQHRFLGTSIQPFACDPTWLSHEQDVVAPRGAAIAAVYATSATAAPVDIDAVSFRGSLPR